MASGRPVVDTLQLGEIPGVHHGTYGRATGHMKVGAHAVLRRARQQPETYPWLTQLLARRPFKVVAVALANKMARIAWALLAKGGTYRAPQLVAA